MDCLLRFRIFLRRNFNANNEQLRGVGLKEGGETSTAVSTDTEGVEMEGNEGSHVRTEHGRLQVKLSYDFTKQELHVDVIQATNLSAMDFGGTSDPYVKLYVLPDKSKKQLTQIHKKQLNPIFNEKFTFKVNSRDFAFRALVMDVYDYDVIGRHEMIGRCQLELARQDFKARKIEHWLPLFQPDDDDSDQLGEACIGIKYVPNPTRLVVNVLEAKGLRVMGKTSTDSFVVVKICDGKKRLQKKHTGIKRSTVNPYFNEPLTFSIDNRLLRRVFVVVKLKHSATVRSYLIGMVRIGCNMSGPPQRHMMDALKAPNCLVARWYTLAEDIDQ